MVTSKRDKDDDDDDEDEDEDDNNDDNDDDDDGWRRRPASILRALSSELGGRSSRQGAPSPLTTVDCNFTQQQEEEEEEEEDDDDDEEDDDEIDVPTCLPFVRDRRKSSVRIQPYGTGVLLHSRTAGEKTRPLSRRHGTASAMG